MQKQRNAEDWHMQLWCVCIYYMYWSHLFVRVPLTNKLIPPLKDATSRKPSNFSSRANHQWTELEPTQCFVQSPFRCGFMCFFVQCLLSSHTGNLRQDFAVLGHGEGFFDPTRAQVLWCVGCVQLHWKYFNRPSGLTPDLTVVSFYPDCALVNAFLLLMCTHRHVTFCWVYHHMGFSRYQERGIPWYTPIHGQFQLTKCNPPNKK